MVVLREDLAMTERGNVHPNVIEIVIVSVDGGIVNIMDRDVG